MSTDSYNELMLLKQKEADEFFADLNKEGLSFDENDNLVHGESGEVYWTLEDYRAGTPPHVRMDMMREKS